MLQFSRGKTPMQIFNLSSLVAESERDNQRWGEFLRVPSLSMGLYRLKVGQADEQQPHTEDEVYFVISGKASSGAGKVGKYSLPAFKSSHHFRITNPRCLKSFLW
jgi:hypothetical protein